MITELQWLMGALQETERRWVDPTIFISSLRDIGGQPINPRIQQDASEFLAAFFEQLEKRSQRHRPAMGAAASNQGSSQGGGRGGIEDDNASLSSCFEGEKQPII